MDLPSSCDAFVRAFAWQLLVAHEDLSDDRIEIAVEFRDQEADELTTAAWRYHVNRTELRDRVVGEIRRRLSDRQRT